MADDEQIEIIGSIECLCANYNTTIGVWVPVKHRSPRRSESLAPPNTQSSYGHAPRP